MNFSVFNNTPISRVFGVNVQPVSPRTVTTIPNDRINVNRELDRLLDSRVIADAMNSNPVIAKLLNDKGIRPVINVENFKNNVYKHSLDTRNKAVGIYNFLPVDLKSESDLKYIQKGAMLHDIGKVLIPAKVLNKNSRLNPKENEIMHLHSKLSSEILSTQNIEPEVLNIVKFHHQNKLGTGYPEMKNSNKGFDVNTEVVSLADKYSALKEDRAYKKGMSDEEALSILKSQVDEGLINPRVYNALVGYVNSLSAPTYALK
jgi:putative nucleotidyltransferase with HDIG domain